jgi:hypothetical protein
MANGNGLLQAALNGDRDHPAAPRTPDELAAEARGGRRRGEFPARSWVKPVRRSRPKTVPSPDVSTPLSSHHKSASSNPEEE